MISKNETKKLKRIKQLEDRLSQINIKQDGAVSYRITNLFKRKIGEIKNTIKGGI